MKPAYPTTSANEPRDPGWDLVTERVVYEAQFVAPQLEVSHPFRRVLRWCWEVLTRYLGRGEVPPWLC